MSAHGKRYDEARAAIDRERLYAPGDAVAALKTAPDAKFDETVEVHFRLGLNVRHADEQLRGTIMLPHGTGREMRVAVFAEGDKAREAQDAGADIVGSADLAAKIEGGFLDFDVAIATPDQMGNVGKLGRVLGPRGLMPNPKTGTVTFDIAKAVSDAKAGKLEYRTDRGANIHLPIGKKSFGERQLLENYAARPRGDRPREARRGEGALYPGHHADDDDGPRHPRRSDPHPRHRRDGRDRLGEGGGCYRLASHSTRPPKTTGSPRAEDRSRWVSGCTRRVRRDDPLPAGLVVSGGTHMLKTEKERVVAELAERLRSTESLIVADYRGLTNAQLEELRGKLRGSGGRLQVVKNTLTRRAAEEAGAESLLALLEGPTAIAFVDADGDPVAVAKALSDTAKETKVLALRGGTLSGRAMTGDEVEELAKLPAPEVVKSQLVGVIVAPLTQLVGLLSAPLRDLVGLIDARVAQLEEGGDTSASRAGRGRAVRRGGAGRARRPGGDRCSGGGRGRRRGDGRGTPDRRRRRRGDRGDTRGGRRCRCARGRRRR